MHTSEIEQEAKAKPLREQLARLESENAELRERLKNLHGDSPVVHPHSGRVEQGMQQPVMNLRHLTDAMPQIFWTTDTEGSVTYYNRGWYAYTGMNFEQTQGRGWKAVTHPDDVLRGMERWSAAMRAGERYEGEFRLRRGSDGAYRWHLSRVSPLRDADGNVVGWVGTSTDIHDYKTQQQSLIEQHEELERRVAERTAALAETVSRLETEMQAIAAADARFRALFEHSTDPHLLFDESGIIDCNDATFTLLGCSDKAQVLSLHPAALSPEFQPDGRRSMEKCVEMDSIARKHGVHRFDWIHRKMDGTNFPVEVIITPVKARGRDGMLVVWHDLTERQRADEALRKAYSDLRKSEQRFQTFMNNSPVLAWIKDEAGEYLYCNRRLSNEIATPPQNLIGKTDADLFPPETAAVFVQEDRKVFQTGALIVDSVVVSANGQRREWHVNKFLLTDPNGQRCAAGLAMDVTDQRRAELALRENEQRLRIALAAGSMGTFTVDLNRNVVTNDAMMNQIHGLDIDKLEWDLDVAFDRVHKDDRAATRAAFEKAVRSGQGEMMEYRIVRPDNEIRWLSGIGRIVGPHAPHLFVGVQSDITDRKANQDRVFYSEQRFKIFMNRSPALATIKDEHGKVEYFNAPFKALFPGKTLEAGKPSVFAPEIVERLHALDRKALADGSVESQLTLPTPDGKLHEFQISKFLFLDAERRKCIGSLWHDVTELVGARLGAEAANRAKSEFLANMSHEIRTPMTAILGHVDLLDAPTITDKERTRHLEVIRRNGQHLLTVLNDILDLSKIEAGKMSIERIVFSLPELVGEIESLVSLRAREKKIACSMEIAEGTPSTLCGDPTRVRQILLNLMGNAIKFTHEGSVRLVVEAAQQNGAGKIRFNVIDTGIGMTPEQQASLFRPFSQADTSTSRRFGGSGLGLAICKRLTDMLGGTLDVTSEMGKGSKFSFTIDGGCDAPTNADSDQAVAAKTKPASKNARSPISGNILLVEDSQDVALMVRILLEDAGLNVDVASDGAAAVERVVAAARDGRPHDLVLMDMQMPVMDGYEATRKLRSLGFLSLPIIAFTAHAIDSEQAKCEEAGCDGYLGKPIDFGVMLSMIGERLRRRNAPIKSLYSDDRLIKRLLRDFVAMLPAIADELAASMKQADFSALRERTHKLKGAGGMYGFPEITRLAANVLASLNGEPELPRVSNAVRDLIDLLHRIEPVNPST